MTTVLLPREVSQEVVLLLEVTLLGVGVDVKSHLRRFSIYFLLKPSWPGLQEIANMNKKAKSSKQSVTM